MEEDRFECPECGKNFGSKDTLKEHADIEHSGTINFPRADRPDLSRTLSGIKKFLNVSTGAGFALGVLFTLAAVGGYSYWQSLDRGVPVDVTVVTCDNCSYDRFKTATDRILNARYKEVDYQSERGQQLIEKYNLLYVPAFIFEKKVEEAENFTRVKHVLVEFEDAYVIPDRGNRVAQRLSSGIELEK